MRNEIFSRINQNKIQYYAELKNVQTGIRIEQNRPEEVNIERVNRVNKTKVALDKSSKFIRQQLSILISIVIFNLRNLNNYLIQKISIQSNRLTEGLSKISSQLFEDQYEYLEHSEIDNNANNQSLIVGLGLMSGATLSIPFEVSNSTIADQLRALLNKMSRDIILFLDSDNWFDEINQSQRYTHDQVVVAQDYSENRKSSKFEIPFYSSVFDNNISKTTFFNSILNIGHSGIYYKKVRMYLNTLSTSLFPTLNRFI